MNIKIILYISPKLHYVQMKTISCLMSDKAYLVIFRLFNENTTWLLSKYDGTWEAKPLKLVSYMHCYVCIVWISLSVGVFSTDQAVMVYWHWNTAAIFRIPLDFYKFILYDRFYSNRSSTGTCLADHQHNLSSVILRRCFFNCFWISGVSAS